LCRRPNRPVSCACDVPSHNYTWSFEPKTDWSANYATSKEIFQYFKDFSKKYGLDRYIQLRHEVVSAIWDEEHLQWHVTVKDLETGDLRVESAHVLVNAGGILNKYRYPPIPGIKTYNGTLVHSAAWPEDLDLSGKVVGLIGNGSSGIQILPAIKSQVTELVTFIREATWVAPPLGEAYQEYSPEEQARFAKDKEYHIAMRKKSENAANGAFGMFHAGSKQQREVRAYMEGEMRTKLHNPDLENVLIPDWAVGCRRLTPGTNYLESLNDSNVRVVYGEITQITETGVICDDGSGEHAVDVLICATGFDTSFRPRFPLIGTAGESLSTAWKGMYRIKENKRGSDPDLSLRTRRAHRLPGHCGGSLPELFLHPGAELSHWKRTSTGSHRSRGGIHDQDAVQVPEGEHWLFRRQVRGGQRLQRLEGQVHGSDQYVP
jgi:cyclohexanone monooxygenase